MEFLQRLRFPLMSVALLALLAAMWAGLLRLGWQLPALTPGLASEHGPLMVAGFLGTLISLERAVALGRAWTYAPPILAALGVLSFLAGLPAAISISLMVLSSLGLIAVFVLIVRRQPALYNYVMLVGAVTWLAGNSLELVRQPVYAIVYWWAGFLGLTIVGERLELSRLRRLSQWDQALFLGALTLFLAGILLTASVPAPGVQITGLGMLALALWLFRYDIARRTVRQKGLTRYVAVCMLSGFAWLGFSGVLAVAFGPVPAGPHYDAVLHTLFIGFVLGMIFGHAPIIVPAVLKVPMTYGASFYAPLILLQLSLLLRVGGDLFGWPVVRQWGGLLNVLAVLLFMSVAARGVLAARRVTT
jgi:hypothetical protein